MLNRPEFVDMLLQARADPDEYGYESDSFRDAVHPVVVVTVTAKVLCGVPSTTLVCIIQYPGEGNCSGNIEIAHLSWSTH